MPAHPLRTIRAAVLLVAAAATGPAAPAAGQIIAPEWVAGRAAPAVESLLWPSWSVRKAALDLRTQVEDSGYAVDPSSGRCTIGWVVGFAAGAAAELMGAPSPDELMGLSPRALFHAAPGLTSLTRIGSTIVKSIACPSPFWTARHAVPRPAPAPPR